MHRCEDAEEVTTAVAAIQALGGNTLIVEAAVPFPDYRVVVFDGAVITCYHRKPLSVIGDGTSTVYQLLHAQRETWRRQGRSLYLDVDDSRITKALRAQGLNREATPAVGQRVKIYEIANLSLGGEAEDHTERLHLHWQTLCVQLTAQMGLRLCGVDLACADITDPTPTTASSRPTPALAWRITRRLAQNKHRSSAICIQKSSMSCHSIVKFAICVNLCYHSQHG